MKRLLPLLIALLAGDPAATQELAPAPVLAGIDVLRSTDFASIAGRRVALLTNLAARSRTGELTLDVVLDAPDVQVVALFAPEHGLTATEDSRIASGSDPRTGLHVFSLYGETRRPTPPMFQGVDAVLIDLPDIGSRFYTYITTMGYVLEEAAKAHVEVVILDRPNPINGVSIEGPTLEENLVSFVGYFPMPVRHGLTMGELAKLFNEEKRLGASLTIVQADGWHREQWLDDTGLPWSDPSPNIRNIRAAALYPGLGSIEWGNISVGRGTPAPFEQLGAPWVDGRALALMLNSRRIPGVQFSETSFTPDSSAYAGERCSGVAITITDRSALRPVRVGIEIAAALRRLHPDRFEFGRTEQLLGSRDTIQRILNGEEPAVIAALWTADEARWRELRSKYLLY